MSRQLAGKCAELVQSQSEQRQAHHMLAAAYAANAALQVRFQHVSVLCCAVLCRAVLCCAVPCLPYAYCHLPSADGLCSCLLVSATRSVRAHMSAFIGLALPSYGRSCCLCLASVWHSYSHSPPEMFAESNQRLWWADNTASFAFKSAMVVM